MCIICMGLILDLQGNRVEICVLWLIKTLFSIVLCK